MIKNYGKKFVGFIFLLFSVLPIHASQNTQNLDKVLELGSQMENVRYMLETYALIATGVSYKAPLERLKGSMDSYEILLVNMGKEFKDKEIQESLKISQEAWKPVKKALMTAFTDTNREEMAKEGLFIHGNIRTVIKPLATMKSFILTKEKIEKSEVLNASIEISASSRRLSAHYMMKMWGLPDPTIEQHWSAGVKIYEDSMNLLKKTKFYENEGFKKLLDECLCTFNDLTMINQFKGKYLPVLVQKKANECFLNANEMSKIILQEIAK